MSLSRMSQIPPVRSGYEQLGVTLRPDGGHRVAVLAPHAGAVDLCIVPAEHASHRRPETRIPMLRGRYGAWAVDLDRMEDGTEYGFRAHGPFAPAQGFFFNPAKLLLDPYARGVTGSWAAEPEDYAAAEGANGPDQRDNARHVPHSVVIDTDFDWGEDRLPRVPWENTILYEAHVRGLTALDPQLPAELRGTYAGLGHPRTIARLVGLGVTSLELLPIHAMADEPALLERGLSNYWGYNTLGFFAPNPAYATAAARDAGSGAVLREVKEMVRALHDAGLEVVLDVVYNHTAEGGDDGPSLSWRGLGSNDFYLHDGGSLHDVTGCGNSLDAARPAVARLVLDSLRYWIQDVHIDGFRFDLAVTLGRDGHTFDPRHPLLSAMASDPSIGAAKLIAEPWDLGNDGWQTGKFPLPFAEWNDAFRDDVRDFWLGHDSNWSGGIRRMATRLAGSSDLFGGGDPRGIRGPSSAINYVTAHDGFTLHDLVTFSSKRNGANGEGNRDGTDDNRGNAHGAEGEVDTATKEGGQIRSARARSQRNLLATLLLAAGTPMLTAGDEQDRTQRGNNNAYCQDNEVSWLAHGTDEWARDLAATTEFLLSVRRTYPSLRPRDFLVDADPHDLDTRHVAWFGIDGRELDHDDWHDPSRRTLQMLRSADLPHERTLLLVLHAGANQIELTLPNEVWLPGSVKIRWSSSWSRPRDDVPLLDASVRTIPVRPSTFILLSGLSRPDAR